jgi:hypothetical protein
MLSGWSCDTLSTLMDWKKRFNLLCSLNSARVSRSRAAKSLILERVSASRLGPFTSSAVSVIQVFGTSNETPKLGTATTCASSRVVCPPVADSVGGVVNGDFVGDVSAAVVADSPQLLSPKTMATTSTPTFAQGPDTRTMSEH